VDTELYQDVTDMWKNGFAASVELLLFKGFRLAREYTISISELKVSYGWVRCFMARPGLTIRHQIMILQSIRSIQVKAG
jgi:hypothetical protein